MTRQPQHKPVARAGQAPARPCPICGRVVAGDSASFPFCSERCRTIDLAKWASGEYVISRPIEQADLEEE